MISYLNNAEYYEVSYEYYKTVLSWNRQHPSAADSEFLEKINRYHLGCNLAGKKLLNNVEEMIKPFNISINNCRFLDIGCGTGGALYGASRLGASYCEGWEINDKKIELAKLNLDTLPENVLNNEICIKKYDIISPYTGDKFDVAICIEVLEHVKDVSLAIKHIADCLNRSVGIAYLRIPNGFSVNNVLKDPHLLIFGLTLLNLQDAGTLARILKNHTHYSQMMGFYLTPLEYQHFFTKYNLKYKVVHDAKIAQIQESVNGVEKIRQRWSDYRIEWSKTAPDDLLNTLGHEIETYTARLEKLINNCDYNELDVYTVDSFEYLIVHQDS